MDTVKNKEIRVELTGINRIIFEYCSFPLLFEDELKVKTKSISKILDGEHIDFSEHLDVYINDSKNWLIGYSSLYMDFNTKFYIMAELYGRKYKYDKIMDFGITEICNACYMGY